MSNQNYHNHIRFYPAHHFVFYPLAIALLVSAIYYAFTDSVNQKFWIFTSAIIFLIVWLAFMLRQHYALTLQNRMIKTEMRYRYFVLTGDRLEPLEYQLSDGQIFALRFAADEELSHLLKRTIAENLSPNAIKKAIVNWHPDHHRV